MLGSIDRDTLGVIVVDTRGENDTLAEPVCVDVTLLTVGVTEEDATRGVDVCTPETLFTFDGVNVAVTLGDAPTERDGVVVADHDGDGDADGSRVRVSMAEALAVVKDEPLPERVWTHAVAVMDGDAFAVVVSVPIPALGVTGADSENDGESERMRVGVV